jgi:hypothetical protein
VSVAPTHQASPHRGQVWERWCAYLAALVPLLVGTWRVAEHAQWSGDLATLRTLGWVPVSVNGWLSAWLGQLAVTLPVGTLSMRLGLVGSVGAAGAGLAAYHLGRRWLMANADTPRLGPVLALSGAWLAVLAPTWQLDAAVPGGATVGAALFFATLLVDAPRRGARTWLLWGGGLGLTTLESPWIGVVLLVSLTLRVAQGRVLPGLRLLGIGATAFVLTPGLLLLPLLIGVGRDGAWAQLAVQSAKGLAGELPLSFTGVERWWIEPGVLGTVTAVAGLLWVVAKRELRRLVLPLLPALLVWLVAVPAAGTRSGPALAVSLLGLVVAGQLSAVGVQTVVLLLQRLTLPLAQPAAVLLAVFHLSAVFVGLDASALLVAQRDSAATDHWTEEALAALPDRAVVLVREPRSALRLLVARRARAERSDLVLAPLALLEHPDFAAAALAEEPALAALIRELAMEGRVGEFSLSSLADARPVVLDVDQQWDPRLLVHVIPGPLWLQFSPTPQGRSDRSTPRVLDRSAWQRVRDVASLAGARDADTLAVLVAAAMQQSVVLATLGDREPLELVLKDLERVDGQQALTTRLRTRLAASPKGALDLRDALTPSARP